MKEVKVRERKEAVEEIFRNTGVKMKIGDAEITRKCRERDGNDLGEIGH